jgi:WD40 repeat protein
VQASLACSPVTLKAEESHGEKTNKGEHSDLTLMYEYQVNDTLHVDFVDKETLQNDPLVILSETTKVHVVNIREGKSIAIQEAPITGFTAAHVFNNGDDVLLVAVDYIQTWNWRDGVLGGEIEAKGNSKISGVTKDGSIAYFDGELWDLSSGKSLLQIEEDPGPNSYDFSSDQRYFVTGGHRHGAEVFDLAFKNPALKIDLPGVSKVRFDENHNIYLSYGAELSMDLGGYYPHSIGYFHINNPEPTANFASPNQITCWTMLDTDEVIVVLAHKEIRLLNQQLEQTRNWRLPEKAFACTADDKYAYIGTQQGALFRIDLKAGLLKQIAKFSHNIEKIKISGKGHYIAIVTRPPGTSTIQVYSLSP